MKAIKFSKSLLHIHPHLCSIMLKWPLVFLTTVILPEKVF